MKPTEIKKMTATALLLVATLVAGGGCDKQNKVSSSKVGTPYYGPGGTLNPATASQVQNIIGQLPCQQGGQRVSATFNTQGAGQASAYGTTIYSSSFSKGNMGGTVGHIYMGKSVYNDLMIIEKMTNGATVVGYNVTLSFCSQYTNDWSGNRVPFISPERSLENFRIGQAGIVLDDNTQCGYGDVDSAQNTYVQSGAYQYLPPADVWTTFFPVCGR